MLIAFVFMASAALEGGALSLLQASWGGTCPWCPPASATYDEFNGEIAKVIFPGADEAALAKLLQASSVASFGKGNQQVTDLSYRDAYKIDPDKLMTSFCPCSTSILSEIEMLMVPN